MACEETVQERTPENVLNGGTWEQLGMNSDTDIYQRFTISFTKNEFTFRMWLRDYYDYTYTGTYKLFYDNESKKKIKFTSSEPKMNGSIFYYIVPIDNITDQYSNKYPDGTIWFIKGYNEDEDSLPCGFFYKKN